MEDALTPAQDHTRELTKEQQDKVAEIKARIDVSDPNAVIQFGVGMQGKISEFADSVLSEVKARDSGQAGKLLTDLMLHIKELKVDDAAGRGGFLSKLPLVGSMVDSARRFMSRYQSVSTQIVKIVEELDRTKARLLKDVDMLEGLYARNREYFDEIGLYIAAGEQKLAELRDSMLPELKARAADGSDPMDAQRFKDMAQLASRLDKKLNDLRLSRTVALHAGPQIRLVQNANHELAEKIQTSVLNTIPLWKNQMVMAIGILRQKQALEFQKEVSNTTRELLEKNAEMLKEGSIEAAKEAERGIVDIETLKKVNAELISTIDETLKIQRDGAIKREQAKSELERIERELKEKLVEVKGAR
jgi:uncharacterized protein YaaN involved in tellurite resistance